MTDLKWILELRGDVDASQKWRDLIKQNKTLTDLIHSFIKSKN